VLTAADAGAVRGGGTGTTQIVGIVLVRNEDLFVEQAIRNAAVFCDMLHVADHMSTDRTWTVVRRVARELPIHHDIRRLGDARRSHRLVEGYAGTATWVFGVDGDELYDAAGLRLLREELLAGTYDRLFRIKSNVLNCVALDDARSQASGYLAPPSRSITKLYNFSAIESWVGCHERLHGGTIVFRDGYEFESVAHLGRRYPWEQSPFRCLHTCFLRRSSRDPANTSGRPNLEDHRIYRRTRFPLFDRIAHTALGKRSRPEHSSWKDDRYRRGPLVTRDATPFFGEPSGDTRADGSR
jgi:hypothetical protein